MKYLDFILQQYLQLSNKYFNQNKKNRHFLMMETHHFYRKNAKIFLAVAPTSGWKQKAHGR